MKEIYRSDDPFKISMVKALLEDRGLFCAVFDEHTGGLYNGLANISPRLMVSDDDVEQALEIIEGAENQGADS